MSTRHVRPQLQESGEYKPPTGEDWLIPAAWGRPRGFPPPDCQCCKLIVTYVMLVFFPYEAKIIDSYTNAVYFARVGTSRWTRWIGSSGGRAYSWWAV